MKIMAEIAMGYQSDPGVLWFERLVYDPKTARATSSMHLDTGETVEDVRPGFGLKGLDACRFLELVGHDSKAGRLRDIQIIEEATQ